MAGSGMADLKEAEFNALHAIRFTHGKVYYL
jgi:hypothetical protein